MTLKLLKTALTLAILSSSQVMAAWSGNAGYASSYHFRGVQQTETGAASAGADYEKGSWSFGSWVAGVDEGLEVDLYGSYQVTLSDTTSLSLGATTYQYTGEFDSAYNEINIGLAFGSWSIDTAAGLWQDGISIGEDAEYLFSSLTYATDKQYVTVGNWSGDITGNYIETGYSTTLSDFDLGVSLIFSDAELSDDQSIVFSISKSFDL